MSLDSAIRKTIKRVIGTTGTPVIVRRVSPPAYNTTTRTVTPATEDFDVLARLDDFTDRERLANGSILVGDRKLFIAATDLDFAPSPSDQVVLDDGVYHIIDPVRREMAQHEPAMYVLQLRR